MGMGKRRIPIPFLSGLLVLEDIDINRRVTWEWRRVGVYTRFDHLSLRYGAKLTGWLVAWYKWRTSCPFIQRSKFALIWLASSHHVPRKRMRYLQAKQSMRGGLAEHKTHPQRSMASIMGCPEASIEARRRVAEAAQATAGLLDQGTWGTI